MSAPLDTRLLALATQPHLHSLASNQLCGIGVLGGGNFTSEGITKLCEGLKGSSVTSLMCVDGLSVCLYVIQCPLTLFTIPASPSVHSLQSNHLGRYGGAALADGLKGNSTLQVLK